MDSPTRKVGTRQDSLPSQIRPSPSQPLAICGRPDRRDSEEVSQGPPDAPSRNGELPIQMPVRHSSGKELRIPSEKHAYLLDLFGPRMRFASRFSALFDCDVTVSGWGTITIRPRSTKSDLEGGVGVIEKILAQNDLVSLQELREEYAIKSDAESDTEIVNSETETQDNNLRQGEVFEMLAVSPRNIQIVSLNLNELQCVSGALFGIAPNGSVCVQGSREVVDQAKHVVEVLIATGRVEQRKAPEMTRLQQGPHAYARPLAPPMAPADPVKIPDHILKLYRQFKKTAASYPVSICNSRATCAQASLFCEPAIRPKPAPAKSPMVPCDVPAPSNIPEAKPETAITMDPQNSAAQLAVANLQAALSGSLADSTVSSSPSSGTDPVTVSWWAGPGGLVPDYASRVGLYGSAP